MLYLVMVASKEIDGIVMQMMRKAEKVIKEIN